MKYRKILLVLSVSAAMLAALVVPTQAQGRRTVVGVRGRPGWAWRGHPGWGWHNRVVVGFYGQPYWGPYWYPPAYAYYPVPAPIYSAPREPVYEGRIASPSSQDAKDFSSSNK